MWMALLGPLPKPAWFGNGAKIGYIVAVRLIQSVLANALLWSGGGASIRATRRARRYWGITPDQRPERGGRDHDDRGLDRHDPACSAGCSCAPRARARRSQELVELAAARGVELDEERAARAVAAGRGDALRERILDA